MVIDWRKVDHVLNSKSISGAAGVGIEIPSSEVEACHQKITLIITVNYRQYKHSSLYPLQ